MLKAPAATSSSMDDATEWHLLNKATAKMKKAKSPVSIIRILARTLNKLGFQLLVGELNAEQTSVKAKLISFVAGEGTIYPITTKNFPFLYKKAIPLKLLAISKQTIRKGNLDKLVITGETSKHVLGTDQQWILDKLLMGRENDYPTPQGFPVVVASINTVGDRIPGYLIFAFKDHYQDGDKALLQTFCSVTTALIENRLLQLHTKKQEKQAETLREVSKIVSSNLHPETVLHSILEQLAKVIAYDSAAVSLEYSGNLQLEAGRGFDPDEPIVGLAVPSPENKLYQEMKNALQPIVINDVRQDSRYTFWAGTSPIRSWIGVPLILRNKVIGQISIDSFKKHAFNLSDGQLAFAFARHVATAIQNARLFEKANRTSDELRALLEGAREVSTSLHTERVIYLTAKRLQQLMNVAVFVYLYQTAARKTLDLTVSLEMHLDQVNEVVIQFSKKLAEQGVKTKEGRIFLPSSSENHPELKTAEPNLTALISPLIVHDTAIGAIVLCRDTEATFAQQDLDLLTRFSLQTAMAIDNTRLYEQLERRLQREGLINNLLRRLSSKLSLPGLVEDIINTVIHITKADYVALTLKDPTDSNAYLHYAQDAAGLNAQKKERNYPAMAALAMKNGSLVWTNNYRQESYAQPSWVDADVQGAIAIPISTRDQVLGAIGIFKQQEAFIRSDEMMSTLEYTGWQTGVAIENALLFQQVNDYAHTLQEKVEARTTEIKRKKEETDAILESAADAIIMTSVDGIIEYVNPAYTGLTGYSLTEATNQSIESYIDEQEDLTKIPQMWQMVSSGKTWRGDIKYKRKDNSIYDADLTVAPIFNAKGLVDKYVAIQRDISKKTELDKLKSLFLVTASHELKTPLTTIQGYTELLLNREFSKSETDQFLKHIHEHALRLSNLASDIIDVSRIEAGVPFLLNPQLINPGPIFNETVIKWQAESAKHHIHFNGLATWPEMKVDPNRLSQIINKLLSNAIKYSPQGGDIHVIVQENLTNLHVSIADNGIGITLDKQAHLFESFWKADDRSVANEGTGLSMVVVKHIIESHGGKIWVESQSGQGTTVSFTLPLSDKATILIIEDDPNILDVEQTILLSHGYNVIASQSGREGLELALSQYPDLIILDLTLPELDGEEILQHLKNTPVTANTSVVIVSAKSTLANIEYAFNIGAVDFLTKPFDLDEFVSRIKVALSSKRI